MNDTTATRSVEIKSKIVFKDLGEPAAVKLLKDGENKLLLGTIMGIARDIKISKAADGMTEFKGLKGEFEAVPADAERPTVKSGVTFLGDAFQADIVAMLEAEDGPESVAFAFEVYAVKAKNPAGYSWALAPLLKAEASDPLAALRAEVQKQRPALIDASAGGKK